MKLMRKNVVVALALALASGAGAAGVLGTSQAVSTSAFCKQYGCSLVENSGREWLYSLKTGTQLLLVQRESGDAGSRITQVSLLSDNSNVNADLDRRTFGEMQKLALGFVSNTGRVENCYALNGSDYRVMADGPDERTRQIYCDWDEAYTRFVIEADRNYLTRTAPSTVASTGPTKLNNWYFTGCDVQGVPSDYLPTGKPSRCMLVINTKGTASQVVRAEFQYEIEYVQNGKYVKKLLPEKEYWWPARTQTGLDPRVSQQGRTIYANLGLAIKSVPGRRVISLNTVARLTFANGVVKTACEPLTVR